MSRTVTITDENSVVLERFVISNRDAKELVDSYSTDWMEPDEFKEYIQDGE